MRGTFRRDFLGAAAALGATAALGCSKPRPSRTAWVERRDFFPQGVASGDPAPESVILWTRCPRPEGATAARLSVEVAEDREFERVVATAQANALPEADWTCRVLVGGLKPARVYYYRFTDEHGRGSRVGRTRTAPAEGDGRPVRFAFVSCQDVSQGALNAYRRMIYEDERAPPDEQLGFVLHLGDFIYEIVWYPEDRPRGMYDRRIRELVRYESGEKVRDFHVPTTLADYRAVYRAYLRDPDLQDARARFPFVCMWDNHEFSWQGFQAIQIFGGQRRPAQTKKVAANQAWFEYQPARVRKPGGSSLERFEAPAVSDAPVASFDEQGLGAEPNNLAAIGSLTAYRSLRWGRHVELFVTDQHSYRSDEPTSLPEAEAFTSKEFLDFMPQEVMEILDAGRAFAGGAPESITFGGALVANPRRQGPPQTILGAEQKTWFLGRLRASSATWKVWGNSSGTLDWRADPQNLPRGLTRPWPGAGYAGFGGGDHSAAYLERAEIYDLVRNARIEGFATISGDRHSFWAGLASKSLPPKGFEPVGVAFVTGSLSAPGLPEAVEYSLDRSHPLRPLYLVDRPDGGKPEHSVNLLLRHGVRACLEYAESRDLAKARARSNPELSPHLSFVDMGGHGYATVRASDDAFEVEFVCLPRPLERSDREDGGPLRYRVRHRAARWRGGERPSLKQKIIEGDPGLSI